MDTRRPVHGFLVRDKLGTAAWSLAQKPAELVPDEEGMVRWGVTAGVVVVIGLTAFLNPKRSHKS